MDDIVIQTRLDVADKGFAQLKAEALAKLDALAATKDVSAVRPAIDAE